MAFVVVAVIAVILLVTSVRSQAAPGWIGRQVPASVVAVAPPTTPGYWSAAGSHLRQPVHRGVVLTHKAMTQKPAPADVVAAVASPTPDSHAITSSSGGLAHTAVDRHLRHRRASHRRHHAGSPRRPTPGPRRASRPGDVQRPGLGLPEPGPGRADHSGHGHAHHSGEGQGRHSGRGHAHHGHGRHAERTKHAAHAWG